MILAFTVAQAPTVALAHSPHLSVGTGNLTLPSRNLMQIGVKGNEQLILRGPRWDEGPKGEGEGADDDQGAGAGGSWSKVHHPRVAQLLGCSL